MVTLNTEWRSISGRQTEAMVIKLSATQSCAKHITLDGNATALVRSIIESKHKTPMWTVMETIICNFQQTWLGYIILQVYEHIGIAKDVNEKWSDELYAIDVEQHKPVKFSLRLMFPVYSCLSWYFCEQNRMSEHKMWFLYLTSMCIALKIYFILAEIFTETEQRLKWTLDETKEDISLVGNIATVTE